MEREVRWVRVRIREMELELQEPMRLPDILRQLRIGMPLYCGGRGQCGRCLVRVLEGRLAVTAADRQCLSAQQLAEGYRLGCQAVVREDCVLELSDSIREQAFYIPPVSDVSSGSSVGGSSGGASGSVGDRPSRTAAGDFDGDMAVAIDLGTTTLSMVLVRLQDGQICGAYAGLNHQRSYGTDVMARIGAAGEGKGGCLQQVIQEDLAEGMRQLREKARQRPGGRIVKAALAGNTTMLHLLRGYDCSGLGSYPFQPYSLEAEQLTMGELLGETGNGEDGALPVWLLPGISAFIGADLAAGLAACGFEQNAAPQLLLDIGTNAEMAVGCGRHIWAASAAAGPAFEGGNLSCGTGSIPGAICSVKIQYGLIRYETIGRQPAVGICGSGVVSAAAELLKNGWMDGNGALQPRYAAEGIALAPGRICLTQRDIREFQKAAAAVRAGLELLLKRSGYRYDDIRQVNLAGGFGCQLEISQAAAIGLLPEALADRTVQVGNTVIGGLIRFLREPDPVALLKGLTASVQEVILAADPDFEKTYISCMRMGKR